MNYNYSATEWFHFFKMKYQILIRDSLWSIESFNGEYIILLEDTNKYHHKTGGLYKQINATYASCPSYDVYRNKRLMRLLL